MSQCCCGHYIGEHDQMNRTGRCEVCMCPGFEQRQADAGVSVYGARSDVNGAAHVLLSKLNPDEPVFVLRAQDILSPQALAMYAELARKVGLPEHAQQVEARAVQFMQWQARHAKLVKSPD